MSESAPGAVTGRVLDGAGAPVGGAAVAVVGSDGPHRDIAARTAADGTFRLGGLPTGAVVLEARKGGTAGSAQVEVSAGVAVPVEIRIG
jgi:hypothetical protein